VDLELVAPASNPSLMPPHILQMVLSGTGEPVDLLHVEDDDQGRRYFVERPCGARLLIAEEQLGCRGFRLN
jgi:hypothetical protein